MVHEGLVTVVNYNNYDIVRNFKLVRKKFKKLKESLHLAVKNKDMTNLNTFVFGVATTVAVAFAELPRILISPTTQPGSVNVAITVSFLFVIGWN